MHFIISANSPPPSKKGWIQPNPSSRREWSSIYEAITTWFCTSHGFNHQHSFAILLPQGGIEFRGEELRYLDPSLRSAASLVHKAYLTLEKSLSPVEKSTPGVYVYKDQPELISTFPEPYYSLSSNLTSDRNAPNLGTIYAKRDDCHPIFVPASYLSQALTWILQEQ